jgi:hypothetical protein
VASDASAQHMAQLHAHHHGVKVKSLIIVIVNYGCRAISRMSGERIAAAPPPSLSDWWLNHRSTACNPVAQVLQAEHTTSLEEPSKMRK